MQYIDINPKTAKEVFFTSGCNGEFYIYEEEGKESFVKMFSVRKEERLKIIKSLINLKYEGTNAFPIKIARAFKEERGYSCNYYKDALCFDDEKIKNIPYELRFKATLQVDNQLQFLHNNNYIVNDIRLSNHMISPSLKDGFMIDFEDMILKDNYEIKSSYYRFYKTKFSEMLPPSQWEDTKKQFICNLSILLLQDLEYYVKCNDEWSLLEKLKDFKEIYEFANQLFSEENILYFKEVSNYFEDEEKVLYYKNKISSDVIKPLGQFF